MEINYLAEIIAFERWLESHYLPIPSQLLWYKLMYIVNKAGWCEWVVVDNLRLMAAVSMSREATLIKARDDLLKAGLIQYQKGKKGSPNKYKINFLSEKNTFKNVGQSEVESEVFPVVKGVVESEVFPVVQSVDIYKHKQKQKQNKKDTDVSKKVSTPDPEKVKHRHGEYKHVTLTDKELERLIADFGEPLVLDAIRYLDEYVEMKGYKHNSSNLTIRKWVIDAVKRERGRQHGAAAGNDTTDTGRTYNAAEYYGDAGAGFTGF
jgi:hypothetical protein